MEQRDARLATFRTRQSLSLTHHVFPSTQIREGEVRAALPTTLVSTIASVSRNRAIWLSAEALAQTQSGKARAVPIFATMVSLRRYSRDGALLNENIPNAPLANYHECIAVNISNRVTIFPIQETLFCCGPGFSNNNTCKISTYNSFEPFGVAAGKVIFNRTSGSTSPNITATTLFTTPTAIILPSTNTPSANPKIKSNQNTEVAIAGVGIPLGLALLLVSGFLFSERRRRQILQREIDVWQQRHGDRTPSTMKQSSEIDKTLHPNQPLGRQFNELYPQGGQINELDSGHAVHEIPNGL